MTRLNVRSPFSPVLTLVRRVLDILSHQGPRVLRIKAINRLRRVDYNRLFQVSRPTAGEIEALRLSAQTIAPDNRFVFSIVVPLFNTQPEHLTEMIESVQAQTDPYWQLCLADGSDRDHCDVETTVSRLAAADQRIVYRKLEQNLGISGNTNAALGLASGRYIALLDHDDLLAPHALSEVRAVIEKEQADLIYSDELNFADSLDDVRLIHFKPDFAIDNLRSNNYICHLTVFAKVLADQIGEFDCACDGSQDYDYILRLSEKAKKIIHIPKILYYWRVHSRSVASDISVKPYCLDAARLALSNHLNRCDLVGDVENGSILSTYRIRYAIDPAARTLLLITIRSTWQLTRMLQVVRQPSGAVMDVVLIVPAEILSSPIEQASWQARFNSLRPGSRLVLYDRNDSLAAVLNREVAGSTADFIAFLDGSVQAVSANWLAELQMLAQRQDVGAVTCKTVSHGIILQAGLATGVDGTFGGYHSQRADGEPGYMARLTFVNNVTAVDRTCMVMRRDYFIAHHGFNERYQRDFFDLDLCLRLGADRLSQVFTPYATVTVSDVRNLPTQILKRSTVAAASDQALLLSTWQAVLQQPDPYYNPNFNPRHARFDQR